MNTTNMELDSIIESFNMDIFIIEHNNFINIINKRINGEILNESIIQEGVKEKFKTIFSKIGEAFKKLIEKVKEIIAKISKAIQSKFFSISFNDLKQLPDDVDLGERIDIQWVIGSAYPLFKKHTKDFENYCDIISKINIDKDDVEHCNSQLVKIDELREKENEEWNKVLGGSTPKIKITGKDVKNNYAKILMLMKEGFKYSKEAANKLYKILNDADKKIGRIGQGNIDIEFSFSGSPQGTYYSKSDFDYGEKGRKYQKFTDFFKNYIKIYKCLCDDIVSKSQWSMEIANQCRNIILKALSILGDEAKKHAGYNYSKGRLYVGYEKGRKYNPDPDWDGDEFDDEFDFDMEDF